MFATVGLHDESGNSLTPREVSNEPLVLSFGNSGVSDSVLILFQLCGVDKVVTHVVVNDSWSASGRVGISQWCEAVRREAESRAAESKSIAGVRQ